MLKRAKTCLDAARQRHKLYADQHRKDVTFAVGDLVLLNTKNISLKVANSNKLLPKWIGPFAVAEVVNPVAYKLELPQAWCIHDVFHVSLLKPYRQDGNKKPPPAPVDIEGELEYEVERILDCRDVRSGKKMQREFLVKWLGYGHEHNSWEPEANCLNAPKALNDYWEFIDNRSQKRKSNRNPTEYALERNVLRRSR